MKSRSALESDGHVPTVPTDETGSVQRARSQLRSDAKRQRPEGDGLRRGSDNAELLSSTPCPAMASCSALEGLEVHSMALPGLRPTACKAAPSCARDQARGNGTLLAFAHVGALSPGVPNSRRVASCIRHSRICLTVCFDLLGARHRASDGERQP